MNTAFDTRVILLFCTLLHGLTGLRLNRVSIPAYKLRGESAFLECQYELNPPNYVANSNSKYQHNPHGAGSGGVGGAGGNDMNYIDADSAAEELPVYRRMRTHSELQQSHHNHHQQQQQQQQEQHHYFNGGASGVGGRVGGYHQAQFPTEKAASPFAGRSVDYDDAAATRRRQTYHDSMSVAGGGGGVGGGGGYGDSTYDAFGRRISGSTYGGHFNVGSDDERDASFGVNESDELPDDSEALYAVKWYKDNEEFYRYVPKANPPKQSYRVDGVRVIEEHSDSTRVLLRGLTLNSTGLYRCEVSAEAPNFSSAQGEGRMDIVYLPRDGPHIKGQQFQYQIGETLNLNCTSGKSHPASHLQWFINEQPVTDTRLLMQYNDTVHKHGLITSTLGLQLTVDARHFFNGAMRVKCLASISPVLWKGGKESVLQRRPGIIDNREAMLLVRSRAASLSLLRSSPCLLALIFSLCTLSQLLLHTALR